MNKQVTLIILDGWGYREDPINNAVLEAETPNFDRYWANYPHTILDASGLAVGLPAGQMGNSEIGHSTIGSGAAIDTDLVRIDKAISEGSFYENPEFINLVNHVKNFDSKIHLIGLLSDGGVHSHQNHLFACLELAKRNNLRKDQVVLHVFTDGRDTLPKTASKYLKVLEDKIEELGIGVIGSIGGRYFGMDRAGNWDRIKMVEDILFEGKGEIWDLTVKPASDYMEEMYIVDPTGKIDEYMKHYVCKNPEIYTIDKNDGILFFNYRSDRARQLSTKILERELNLYFVSMTQYGDHIPTKTAYKPVNIPTCLAKELASANLSQSHISESEKFPHVTFFFNGLSDTVYPKEKQIKIESRTDIATHDMAPEMKSKEITERAIEEFDAGANFILINYPNPDVVGHTGNVPAIITACETCDYYLGKVVDHILSKGGVAIITADHGNAELNVDPATGEKHTAHTTNPVPIIFAGIGEHSLREHGTIADIAPSILNIFGLESKVMFGKTLIKESLQQASV